MRFKCHISLSILLFSQAAWSGQTTDRPRLPFLDWGACPFECCTYREWVAFKPVTAYKNRDEKSVVAFKVKKNESVRAITGVIATQKVGVTEILKPVKLGYTSTSNTQMLSLNTGEKLYTLHYAGEGYEVFWYKGKTYADELGIPNADVYKTHSKPTYVWWAKIRNQAGKIGWTKHTDDFNNQDACG